MERCVSGITGADSSKAAANAAPLVGGGLVGAGGGAVLATPPAQAQDSRNFGVRQWLLECGLL